MATDIEKRMSDLEKRITALETALRQFRRHETLVLESSMPDHSTWYQQGEGHTNGMYTLAAQMGLPWISKSVRITEQLTSFEFAVKTQLGQAVLFGLGGTVVGAGAAWLMELPWYAAPVLGMAAGTLALTILLLDHRGMVHRVITDAGSRPGKQRTELRVQIDQRDAHSRLNGVEFLYVSGIEHPQLRTFAAAAVKGASLAVHKWTGRGALFTRSQFDDLMTELEQFGYIKPATGNVARQLTRKGRALMRALAE
jgi:hypothetical protein